MSTIGVPTYLPDMKYCPWCGGQNLENYGVPADVYVDNTPSDFLAGRDAQIEKAVQVLQEELKKNPPKDVPGR